MFCLSGLGSLWQICRHQGLSGIHSKLEGYFFPWHFAAETAPSRKLRSVTLPNMSFLLLLIFYFHRKRRQMLANETWPMRMWQGQAASTGSGEIDQMPFFTHKKTILGTTGWNLCYAGGRSLTVSYQLFQGIYLSLCWSRFLTQASVKKAVSVESRKGCRNGSQENWPQSPALHAHVSDQIIPPLGASHALCVKWRSRCNVLDSFWVLKTKGSKLVWPHASITKVNWYIYPDVCVCVDMWCFIYYIEYIKYKLKRNTCEF